MNRRIAIIGPALGALLALGACDNVQRSMVFMTGTTVGVDVAVAPQSDAPVHLTIGYKRAEVLFDPIMEDCDCLIDLKACEHGKQPAPGTAVAASGGGGQPAPAEGGAVAAAEPGANDGKTRYKIKDEPHSVLAKLLGQVNTSASSGAGQQAEASGSIAQWFASGRAAEILAANGGGVLLTDSPGVARAAAEARKSFGGSLKPEERAILPFVVRALYKTLDGMRDSDPEAGPLADDLNKVADDVKLPSHYDFVRYRIKSSATTPKELEFIKVEVKPETAIDHNFNGVWVCHAALVDSVQSLDQALVLLAVDPALLTLPAGVTPELVRKERDAQRTRLEALTREITTNSRVIRAAEHLQKRLG